MKDPGFEKVHTETYGKDDAQFFDDWEVSYETQRMFMTPVYEGGLACEGKHTLLMGATNVSFTVNQTVRMTAALAEATHLSFLLSVVSEGYTQVMPTLFVAFGATTVLVHADLLGAPQLCTLVNVPVPETVRTHIDEDVRVSFRTVNLSPIIVLVDNVRFVTLRDGAGAVVETPSQPVAAGQCAPGCATQRDAGVYYPACDTVACGFATQEHSPWPRAARTGLCANQARAFAGYSGGPCGVYNASSCCRTAADESAAYARAAATIDAHCDLSSAPECARELALVRCAPCHPSSSLHTEGGSVKLCAHYAEDVFARCAPHCPGIAAADAREFFAATGLGVLYGNTRKCFNGAHTGEYFLLRTELIVIIVVSVLVFVAAVVVIVFVALHSARVATTIDDKYEPDADAVGATSAAPFEEPAVAMESVAPPASVGMVNGPLDSQAMMMPGTTSTAAPGAFMSANFDPALQQTQGGI